MSTTRARRELPELPLTGWEETKNTLHLWAQIVGKVRMASTAPRNHWWHVTLYVDVRGLTSKATILGPKPPAQTPCSRRVLQGQVS
jgi:hypothetical protein